MTTLHPIVRDWFAEHCGSATEPQARAWPAIRSGENVLISAPTGSGKTLAAFLICLDDLVRAGLDGSLPDTTQVLYVSPLKALSNDIHKNLDVPLSGIASLAGERGLMLPAIRTAVRTGDPPASERQRMVKHPPHILVTTPESLFILLTADRSRQAVRGRSASDCRRRSGPSRRSRAFLRPTSTPESPSSITATAARWILAWRCPWTSSARWRPTRCGGRFTIASPRSSEEKLKTGKLKAVVATASLELGIDIGTVDLVCQIGSPRSIAVALQRIGRSGHQVEHTTKPKGRIFATTRDELIECAALVRAISQGELDRLLVPVTPLDVMGQQIVAMAAAEDWQENDLFALIRRAYCYADLTRADFDAVIEMLSEGISTKRGRSGAFVHRDRVHGVVRGRRGARLAAITSGGAIPDNAQFLVLAEPDETVVGTLDEDFAVESMAGDVFMLGSTSWRIRRVESGRVRVEDAKGAAPTIPFWRGEAPGRTWELSSAVLNARRATVLNAGGANFWVAAERLKSARLLWPDSTIAPDIDDYDRTPTSDRESAATETLRGWLESSGPQTQTGLSQRFALPTGVMEAALLRLEAEGQILRGPKRSSCSAKCGGTRVSASRLACRPPIR